LVKSRRTDAAQPPHVMLGTLSETSTNFEGSTTGAASAASDVFGASGVEPPAGGVVGAEPPPESHPIRAHERLIAISQAVKFFMGQFSTIGLKRTPRTRPFSLVWLQHQTTRSDPVHTVNVDPMSRIVKGNAAQSSVRHANQARRRRKPTPALTADSSNTPPAGSGTAAACIPPPATEL